LVGTTETGITRAPSPRLTGARCQRAVPGGCSNRRVPPGARWRWRHRSQRAHRSQPGHRCGAAWRYRFLLSRPRLLRGGVWLPMRSRILQWKSHCEGDNAHAIDENTAACNPFPAWRSTCSAYNAIETERRDPPHQLLSGQEVPFVLRHHWRKVVAGNAVHRLTCRRRADSPLPMRMWCGSHRVVTESSARTRGHLLSRAAIGHPAERPTIAHATIHSHIRPAPTLVAHRCVPRVSRREMARAPARAHRSARASAPHRRNQPNPFKNSTRGCGTTVHTRCHNLRSQTALELEADAVHRRPKTTAKTAESHRRTCSKTAPVARPSLLRFRKISFYHYVPQLRYGHLRRIALYHSPTITDPALGTEEKWAPLSKYSPCTLPRGYVATSVCQW